MFSYILIVLIDAVPNNSPKVCLVSLVSEGTESLVRV